MNFFGLTDRLIQINVTDLDRESFQPSLPQRATGRASCFDICCVFSSLTRPSSFYLSWLPSRRIRRQIRRIQEEVWAIPVTLPTIAYVVRPVGSGPFPLVVMNHGVSLNQRERSFFPLVEFRDAAMWFARRGYMVVAPSGPGYGAAALDEPERGRTRRSIPRSAGCDNPNFRDAGLAMALLDKWIIEYMTEQKRIVPDNVIVVGQSAGGWAAIALSSQNLPPVRAIITFAAGRGGRVGGKPNNNCAPDKLVIAAGEFGRSARIPMLWIYIGKRYVFRAGLIEANARGLCRRRRQS